MSQQTWAPLKKPLLFVLGILVAGCAMETQIANENESDFAIKEQAISSVLQSPLGPNVKSFDYARTWGCWQWMPTTDAPPYIYCHSSDESPYAGYKPAIGNLPSNGLKYGTRSIAVTNPDQGVASIYVLGADNVVRVATGRPATTHELWLQLGWFQNYSVAVKAETTTGASICISMIAAFDIPAHYAAHRLIALSCTGDIYYKSGNQWAALATNSPAPFNAIPREKYTEISRGGRLAGYLLNSSTKRIFMVGGGTYNHANYVISWVNKTLPPLPNNLLPTHVGGTFVLTNKGNGLCNEDGSNPTYCPGDNERVYRYDIPLNAWRLPSGNLVAPRAAEGATGTPWWSIADGSGMGTNIEHYYLGQYFYRLYEAL